MRPLAIVSAAVLIALPGVRATADPPASDRIEQAARTERAASAPSAPLLLDRSFLEAVKARLQRGDKALAPALTSLEADAAAALAMKPVSVIAKSVTPPSGDKHDYMSQAPYWWPDPSTPGGHPYIRRDGERNPEINGITDHDNLGRLVNAVATLGLAFYFTGQERYAEHATKLLRVWFLDPATRMNPHLRFGQGIPGINVGRGIGIIETRGLPEMLDGVAILAGSTSWTAADDASLRLWMRDYLTWLIDSPHGQEEARNGNNHETWYDVQVATLAEFTAQPDLARRTIERSRDRIARQIEPDGRQPRELERTRSWNYSVFNLTAFFQLATIGERAGVDLWNHHTADGRGLRRALEFLIPFAAGKQKWPYPQISGFDPGALHWILRRAAVAWKEPAYRALAAQVGGGRARLDLTLP